jgi:hypothetical protein
LAVSSIMAMTSGRLIVTTLGMSNADEFAITHVMSYLRDARPDLERSALDLGPRARHNQPARLRPRHAIIRRPPPEADGIRLERCPCPQKAGYIVFWLRCRG